MQINAKNANNNNINNAFQAKFSPWVDFTYITLAIFLRGPLRSPSGPASPRESFDTRFDPKSIPSYSTAQKSVSSDISTSRWDQATPNWGGCKQKHNRPQGAAPNPTPHPEGRAQALGQDQKMPSE